MSVLGIIDAIRAEVAPAYRLVWACLENHANGERWWPATEQQLADELHISCDTVGRAIGWLTCQRIIRVERRKRRPSVFHMLRRYEKGQAHFTQQKAESTEADREPETPTDDAELTQHPADSTGPVIDPTFAPSTPELTPQPAEPTLELTPQFADSLESTSKNPPVKTPPDSKRARARLSKGGPEFAEFYSAYPRKAAIDKAAKAYAAAIGRGSTHAEIMEGLRRQQLGAFSAWNPDPQYQPHPATWLNGGRWKDQPPSARPRFDPGNLTGARAALYELDREDAELARRETSSAYALIGND